MTYEKGQTMERLVEPQVTIGVIQKYNFAFRKRFGQNFLIDGRVLEKIIKASGVTKDDFVLEIGPGIGTLTQALSEAAAAVAAVEIDRDLGITEPVPAPEPVRVAPAQTVSQEQPERKPIAFIAWLNREQFEALNQCIKSNHIKVKQLKKGDDDRWQ